MGGRALAAKAVSAFRIVQDRRPIEFSANSAMPINSTGGSPSSRSRRY
jgi:hypothetical protein